jgi:hypothetical protein
MNAIKGYRRGRVVLVGALALFALPVAAALGGKGLRTRPETVTVEPLKNGAATPTCKRGTKAISGGFDSHYDPHGTLGFFEPNQLRRTSRREWTGAALNNSLEDRDYTAYAYCRDQKLKTRSATTSVAPSELGTVTAKCKGRQKAFSGGFALSEFDNSDPNSPIMVVTGSLREGKRKWTASASNAPNDVATMPKTGNLSVYVYCREGKTPNVRRAKEALAPSEFDSAKATCKRSQRVVSGGFDLKSDFQTTRAFVMTSRKVGMRSWEIAALNGPTTEHSIVAYAYCEKKRRARRL